MIQVHKKKYILTKKNWVLYDLGLISLSWCDDVIRTHYTDSTLLLLLLFFCNFNGRPLAYMATFFFFVVVVVEYRRVNYEIHTSVGTGPFFFSSSLVTFRGHKSRDIKPKNLIFITDWIFMFILCDFFFLVWWFKSLLYILPLVMSLYKCSSVVFF